MALYTITSFNRRDPYWHMALEEFCFRSRHLPMPLMLMYINDPSVIIGRNQNGWLESDGRYLADSAIPIVRRITGGGAVVHDPGNLNMAVIADAHVRGLAAADPWVTALAEILQNMGVAIRRTDQNDLLIGDAKISGHARYTNFRRLIAHSSLLVNADLDRLRQALRPVRHALRSRAVASRPRPVTNLTDHLFDNASMADVIDHLSSAIGKRYGLLHPIALTPSDREAINALARNRFRSWAWTHGRTPVFEIDGRIPFDNHIPVRLTVAQGLIRSMTFRAHHLESNQKARIRNQWTGYRFSWQWMTPATVDSMGRIDNA